MKRLDKKKIASYLNKNLIFIVLTFAMFFGMMAFSTISLITDGKFLNYIWFILPPMLLFTLLFIIYIFHYHNTKKMINNGLFTIYQTYPSKVKAHYAGSGVTYQLFFDDIELKLFNRKKGVYLYRGDDNNPTIEMDFFVVYLHGKKSLMLALPTNQYMLSDELYDNLQQY